MELFLKILRISFWILLAAGLSTVFAFVQKQEDDLLCSQVNISILRDPLQENYFVNEGAIRELIAQRFGQVENTSLKNIDVNYLEHLMYANPWVARAEVYLSINGVVDIEIEQRQPILRIINVNGENYYMDSRGRLMRWSPDFTPRALIASGNIKEKYEEWNKIPVSELINNDTLKTRTMLDDLYMMAKFILADEFWSAHVEQLYVNMLGEIELVPKVGNHTILFGGSDEIAEKFWKLKTFYKEGLNYTGWDNYDTLNLKFNNQVVCSKAVMKSAYKK
ncbi:MAG: cell division protein FtsQ [Bacteroidetes bacterium]|nr:MAG: cell division protein FtsQ [Bacteroidota bacterium]